LFRGPCALQDPWGCDGQGGTEGGEIPHLIAIKEAKKSSPSPHWLMGPHFTGRVFDFWRIWCVVFYRPLNSLLYYALKVQDVFVPMAVRSPLWNWSKKTIIGFE